jgi:hypothetical protein
MGRLAVLPRLTVFDRNCVTAPNSCRHAITQVLSPITSMAHGFSIRTAYPQEAGVICCAGLSIVAGVARRQSGRSRHHRLLWTAHRHAFEGTAWRISYVGHATFLIQTAGLNILLDSVWSKRANLKIS